MEDVIGTPFLVALLLAVSWVCVIEVVLIAAVAWKERADRLGLSRSDRRDPEHGSDQPAAAAHGEELR